MKLYRVQALLLKYWYISKNSLDRMFDLFYWPLVGMIVFGFTTLYIEKVADFPDIFMFLLGGLLLWILFERVQQDVTVYILEDFWSGNVANSFTTPVKESEIFVSTVLLGFVRSLLSFFVMFLVALFAYKFNLFAGSLLSILFVIPLFMFGWGLGIFISGLIFKFGMRIQIFAWGVTYLLQPLAAAFYPLETLPLILQKVAMGTPLMWTFEGYRLAYQGSFSLLHLGIAIGLSILYIIIGYLFFVRSVKGAKKSGLLTKH